MALKDTIMEDLITAMRNKDNRRKGVLQLVKAGLEAAEKEKKSSLTEQEEIAIVQREVKQNKDFLIEAKKLQRTDCIEDANQKIAILYKYLPDQLTEDEVKQKLIDLGVSKGMNMGAAMKLALPSLKGKAESAVISKLVNQMIS